MRHREATTCSHVREWVFSDLQIQRVTPALRCGFREFDAIHDPARTLPLSPNQHEADRHTYLPEGTGICAICEDAWPCEDVRIREAARAVLPEVMKAEIRRNAPSIAMTPYERYADRMKATAERWATLRALLGDAAPVDGDVTEPIG